MLAPCPVGSLNHNPRFMGIPRFSLFAKCSNNKELCDLDLSVDELHTNLIDRQLIEYNLLHELICHLKAKVASLARLPFLFFVQDCVLLILPGASG